ncbi:MAG TPA: M28 family peptidase [Longimicrobiaceae bacterium]|nr:M28 family peptidase [Longimicrobiaceae bacterium]
MTTRIPVRRAAWVLLLAACASPPAPADTPAPAAAAGSGATLEAAAATITAADMRRRIAFLASDEMRGRDTPSPELERAAEWLADELRRMGLQPAGDPGSYLQRYPLRKMIPDSARAGLSAVGAAGGPTPVYGRDLFVVPSGRDSASGPAVFLGPASRLADDTPDALEGRIAVVTLGPSIGLEILQAPADAARAGAAGLVFVLDPALPAEVVGGMSRQIGGSSFEVPIHTVGLRAEAMGRILRAAGVDPAVLADGARAPAPLGARLRLSTPVRRVEHPAPNVVAVLPGSDPALRDEYVVLSAHFDHVGVGAPNAAGDSVYNGADDDASGTAAILEVAEALSGLERRPARSVAILAVSGEEKGLVGSRWFGQHPTLPMERVVANINLDMVGRNAPDSVVAIGEEYSSLGPLARRIAAGTPALGLAVAPDPVPEEQLFFRSDHVAFLRRDVPALFFTTLLHPDYHAPSDEVEKIDADKAARIARLVFLLTHAVADASERPAWQGDGLARVRRMLERSPF